MEGKVSRAERILPLILFLIFFTPIFSFTLSYQLGKFSDSRIVTYPITEEHSLKGELYGDMTIEGLRSQGYAHDHMHINNANGKISIDGKGYRLSGSFVRLSLDGQYIHEGNKITFNVERGNFYISIFPWYHSAILWPLEKLLSDLSLSLIIPFFSFNLIFSTVILKKMSEIELRKYSLICALSSTIIAVSIIILLAAWASGPQ